MTTNIEQQIEDLVSAGEPDAEVLLVEVAGGRTIRVFLDAPGGVTLDLCERVTKMLDEFRERYAIEVSSPGAERPLTRPAHFKRFSGRTAKIRLAEAMPGESNQTLRGEIVEADDERVVVLTDSGRLEVAYGAIGRANLVAA